MPLGEQVGARLPLRAPQPVVLIVIFALGVLCTIAEPAIGALKEAGQNITPSRAPLLSLILDQPFILMIIVGVGVGFAAVFGCVRLVYDVTMKPCLWAMVIPALGMTALCVFQNGGFPTVTGLAWDCGAVTTGPVTVPIVLALGIGVSAAAKAKREAAANTITQDQVEGSFSQHRETARSNSVLEAIDPTVYVRQKSIEAEADLSGFGIVTFASLMPVPAVWALGFAMGGADATHPGANVMTTSNPEPLEEEVGVAMKSLIGTTRAVLPLVGFLLFIQYGLIREPLANPKVMLQGLGFCYLGMFLFTIGLEGALIPLGSEAGRALPNAMARYGDTYGPIVMLIFGFLSGLIATFAEPALLAMGETVERLTNKKYTKNTLLFSVALGVALGIALGMAKVYYQLNLFIILVVGYSICLALTIKSNEVVACIAWDSAGVTTGPVTVPIVLASGLALGDAASVAEGFGILSCASIGPISMVLLSGLLTGTEPARRVPAAGAELASSFNK
jgi:hypothetical protein